MGTVTREQAAVGMILRGVRGRRHPYSNCRQVGQWGVLNPLVGKGHPTAKQARRPISMRTNNSTRARQSRRPAYMFSDSHRGLVAAQMVEHDGYSVAHASGVACVNPGYVRAVLHADLRLAASWASGKLRLVDLWRGYCTERRRHQAAEAKAQAEAKAKAEAESRGERARREKARGRGRPGARHGWSRAGGRTHHRSVWRGVLAWRRGRDLAAARPGRRRARV